jgi:hypothetical protein
MQITQYSSEKIQTGMFQVNDHHGNRIGIVSGQSGKWTAELPSEIQTDLHTKRFKTRIGAQNALYRARLTHLEVTGISTKVMPVNRA